MTWKPSTVSVNVVATRINNTDEKMSVYSGSPSFILYVCKSSTSVHLLSTNPVTKLHTNNYFPMHGRSTKTKQNVFFTFTFVLSLSQCIFFLVFDKLHLVSGGTNKTDAVTITNTMLIYSSFVLYIHR